MFYFSATESHPGLISGFSFAFQKGNYGLHIITVLLQEGCCSKDPLDLVTERHLYLEKCSM